MKDRKKDVKMESRFSPELEKAIRDDITLCQKAIDNNPHSTHALYRAISSKYSNLYPHLCDGIPSIVKSKYLDDYSTELKSVISVLQGILLVKMEPIQQDQVPVINIGKMINKKGNIGNNNQLSNTAEVQTTLQAQYKPRK